MKLIIREYLASLRERGELDAILPDLLTEMGLTVFSRPGRGTRQDGVDVGAVGSLNGGPAKVYLFTIKAGDLSRSNWDGDPQSVRPSLNEILDAYIPNRLPSEHRGKPIVICLCFGGDVLETVRPAFEGYIRQNTQSKVSFEEWNGDKLAALIQSNFLREDVLPDDARSHLRKALAMLDEPETAYKHFAALVRLLSAVDQRSDAERVRAIRQMSICVWMLFAWARAAKNMEAAYTSSELALLHAWTIARLYAGDKNKTSQAVLTAFMSIFSAYHEVSTEFLEQDVLPHAGKLHGISSAIRGACSLDINLKLFDLVGRLGLEGIWALWGAQQCSEEDVEATTKMLDQWRTSVSAVKALVSNNPALLSPVKDAQSIDLSIALLLLATDARNHVDIRNWLRAILERSGVAYIRHGRYPCTLDSYTELLAHPKTGDTAYRETVTSGSLLYPLIALWAALCDDNELYESVAELKKEHLGHCNFQLWYPDEHSEAHFYTNSETHGAILSHVAVDQPKEEFLKQVFGECDQTSHYRELSAAKHGWSPLLILACRHHRLPLPLHLLERPKKQAQQTEDQGPNASPGGT